MEPGVAEISPTLRSISFLQPARWQDDTTRDDIDLRGPNPLLCLTWLPRTHKQESKSRSDESNGTEEEAHLCAGACLPDGGVGSNQSNRNWIYRTETYRSDYKSKCEFLQLISACLMKATALSLPQNAFTTNLDEPRTLKIYTFFRAFCCDPSFGNKNAVALF